MTGKHFRCMKQLPAGYTVEVDNVPREQWSEWLNRFDDANLYQTWAYGEVRWGVGQISHCIVKRAGEVVAMAQVRVVAPPGLRLGVSYLRWGPVFERRGLDLDQQNANAIAAALYNEYVVKRGTLLRILPNATLNTSRAEVLASAFSDYRTEAFGPGDTYRTLMLDIRPSLGELRQGLSQKWRNQLNRAGRNNLRVVEGSEGRDFDRAISIVEETRLRKGFNTSSDVREFKQMQAILTGRQKMRVFVCEQNGAPVASAISTSLGKAGIYLFGGTSNEGMEAKGSYLVQWRIIEWLKQEGVQIYNLGGINPQANPGVYHFKRGMSGDDRLYMPPMSACENSVSGTLVHYGVWMKQRWRWLLRQRMRHNGVTESDGAVKGDQTRP